MDTDQQPINQQMSYGGNDQSAGSEFVQSPTLSSVLRDMQEESANKDFDITKQPFLPPLNIAGLGDEAEYAGIVAKHEKEAEKDEKFNISPTSEKSNDGKFQDETPQPKKSSGSLSLFTRKATSFSLRSQNDQEISKSFRQHQNPETASTKSHLGEKERHFSIFRFGERRNDSKNVRNQEVKSVAAESEITSGIVGTAKEPDTLSLMSRRSLSNTLDSRGLQPERSGVQKSFIGRIKEEDTTSLDSRNFHLTTKDDSSLKSKSKIEQKYDDSTRHDRISESSKRSFAGKVQVSHLPIAAETKIEKIPSKQSLTKIEDNSSEKMEEKSLAEKFVENRLADQHKDHLTRAISQAAEKIKSNIKAAAASGQKEEEKEDKSSSLAKEFVRKVTRRKKPAKSETITLKNSVLGLMAAHPTVLAGAVVQKNVKTKKKLAGAKVVRKSSARTSGSRINFATKNEGPKRPLSAANDVALLHRKITELIKENRILRQIQNRHELYIRRIETAKADAPLQLDRCMEEIRVLKEHLKLQRQKNQELDRVLRDRAYQMERLRDKLRCMQTTNVRKRSRKQKLSSNVDTENKTMLIENEKAFDAPMKSSRNLTQKRSVGKKVSEIMSERNTSIIQKSQQVERNSFAKPSMSKNSVVTMPEKENGESFRKQWNKNNFTSSLTNITQNSIIPRAGRVEASEYEDNIITTALSPGAICRRPKLSLPPTNVSTWIDRPVAPFLRNPRRQQQHFTAYQPVENNSFQGHTSRLCRRQQPISNLSPLTPTSTRKMTSSSPNHDHKKSIGASEDRSAPSSRRTYYKE